MCVCASVTVCERERERTGWPFSPPDRDRRVDSPALSARGSDLPGAPQDEAGLTRKFETLGVALESLQGLRDLT